MGALIVDINADLEIIRSRNHQEKTYQA